MGKATRANAPKQIANVYSVVVVADHQVLHPRVGGENAQQRVGQQEDQQHTGRHHRQGQTDRS